MRTEAFKCLYPDGEISCPDAEEALFQARIHGGIAFRIVYKDGEEIHREEVKG